MISRHPSLTPICGDLHPLHHYTHPFNLTSRWWLEACEVCVSMCAYHSLCVRCFSPYANHSLALRINLQMCHYPSGSAAITLQLHNSRLASWAPHTCMQTNVCTHTHVHTRTKHRHTHAASTAKRHFFLKDFTFCFTTTRKTTQSFHPSDIQRFYSLITAPHLRVNRTATKVSWALSHTPVS